MRVRLWPGRQGGSAGRLCQEGPIGRVLNQVFLPDATGRASVSIDLTIVPQLGFTTSIQAGQTWYAQAWQRDTVAGSVTSNFTVATAMTFD
ncbi:MAG: hypothetical protein ACI80K_002939 [Paracoccaceae bacterium]